MRVIAALIVCAVITIPFQASARDARTGAPPITRNIKWLGHDTFRITGEKTIYTDPLKIRDRDTADLIIITHDHFDHCSPEDVKKLQGPATVIVAPADCIAKLTGNLKAVKPGDSLTVSGIPLEVVPAYNTNKKFHPRSKRRLNPRPEDGALFGHPIGVLPACPHRRHAVSCPSVPYYFFSASRSFFS